VDELGGAFADDMGAEQSAALEREDKLQEAGVDAHDMAARGLAETRDADLIGDACGPHLFFRLADGRDFRHGVDAIGKGFRRRRQRHAEGVAGGHPALLHRGRCKAREADDVARRVDVRHAGLKGDRIHLDAAARVGLDADRLQAEAGDIAGAAGRVQYDFGADRAAVRQNDLGAIRFRQHFFHRRSKAHHHAAVAHLVDEIVDDFPVDEVEYGRPRLDQRDGNVERRKDRRILDPDDARADDGQRARQTVEFKHLVAVEDAPLVERHIVRAVWASADRDQRVVERRFAVLAGVGFQGHTVPVDEAGGGAKAAHRIAHELVLQHLDLVIQRLVQALDEIASGNILLQPRP
jgi:hypothetical protein